MLLTEMFILIPTKLESFNYCIVNDLNAQGNYNYKKCFNKLSRRLILPIGKVHDGCTPPRDC